MSGLLYALVAALAPPGLSFGVGRAVLRASRRRALQDWFAVAVLDTVAFPLLTGSWPGCAGSIASALVAAAAWWWDRHRRDPAKRSIGGRAKALRDALVRKVRQAAKPRPVPRPAPGGAR